MHHRSFTLFVIFLLPLSAPSLFLTAQEISPLNFSDLHVAGFSSTEPIEPDLPEIAPNDKPNNLITFKPPAGWRHAEASALPASVKSMVIGTGDNHFPPSINLGMEVYPGTLKQYLKRIKAINKAQNNLWKDLGKIRTAAGDASLSQMETKTQWGDVKMMHVIIKEKDTIYILTAAALKTEFPKFYKDFFHAFRSLHIKPVA